MGKPVKLTDRNKEWFLRSKGCGDRNVDTREEREKILIVCEGTKTEPNYFEAFKRELPSHSVQVEICGEGMNTLSLVVRTQEIRSHGTSPGRYPFDQVWVVFDRDSFESDFDNAIDKARASDIRCAWSNEAFELWYILHFEYRTSGMSRSDYQDKLTKLLNKKYEKNAKDIYEELAARGDQQQAIAWARKLHDEVHPPGTPPSRMNPCTTVFQLVEELNHFKVATSA